MNRPVHHLSPSILKACDIRGIVDQDLHPEDGYYIGRAFATELSRRGLSRCVVGYDGRHSSPHFCREFIRGLTDSGTDVIALGLVPTPLVYFALRFCEASAGAIVTASHNPPEYNGFKFFTADGPFHGEEIQRFRSLCEDGGFSLGRGSVEELDVRRAYIDHLLDQLEGHQLRDLRLVWDPGNGAAGAVLRDLVDRLPGRHTIICGEVDGDFPNHHPDPSLEKNVEQLKRAVLLERADAGIAFDGDADRLGIVDDAGNHWLGDQLLVLFARELLACNPGAAVMSEVKASSFLYRDVAAHGGRPIMWKVGHTNQKERMLTDRIALAGETSGHIFFAENDNYDDGLFAAVKLITILGASDRSLSAIRGEFPPLFDSGEIRLELSGPERDELITAVAAQLRSEGRRFIDIDGIRADFAGGFWMLRGSNTLPHVTIRCEGESEEELQYGLDDLSARLDAAGWKGGLTRS